VEAEQRHFGEQSLGVPEMVRWGGGRNADAARRLAQREALNAAFHNNLLRRGDKLTSQVAVMIGLPDRLGRLPSAGLDLDTVQIES
jgi:hypothetical protein